MGMVWECSGTTCLVSVATVALEASSLGKSLQGASHGLEKGAASQQAREFVGRRARLPTNFRTGWEAASCSEPSEAPCWGFPNEDASRATVITLTRHASPQLSMVCVCILFKQSHPIAMKRGRAPLHEGPAEYAPWPPMTDYRRRLLLKYSTGSQSAKATCQDAFSLGAHASMCTQTLQSMIS
jgi:hypothetical protein